MAPGILGEMKQYRVEAVRWDGHTTGAEHLERALNDWAAEGWEVLSVIPTQAGTSIRSLVAASASADTTEFAIVLRRVKR
jgi:hypothetical protein